MNPVFAPGDMLVLAPVVSGKVRPGDIVTYRSPRNPAELVSHRVVNVNTENGTITTKGDALQAADPAINRLLVQAQAVAVVPRFGHITMWLRTWPGLIVAIYIPAGGIIVSELRRLNQSYGRPGYQLLAR